MTASGATTIRPIRMSALQVCDVDDESDADRNERVAELVREQRGADLIALPDLWSHGGFAYETLAHRTGARLSGGTHLSSLTAEERCSRDTERPFPLDPGMTNRGSFRPRTI